MLRIALTTSGSTRVKHQPERLGRRAFGQLPAWLRLGCLVALLVCLLPSGCSVETAHDENETKHPRATREARVGEVKVVLSADDDLTLEQPLTLRLELTASEAVSIDWPNLAGLLTEQYPFECREIDAREIPPVLTQDGVVVSAREALIEFVLPGEYEIPSLSLDIPVHNGDQPAISESNGSSTIEETKSVELDPITITVRESDDASLAEADPTKLPTLQPLELAPEPGYLSRHWWMVPTGIVVLGLLGLMLARLLLRERALAAARPIPAHEWARAELDSLASDDLLAKSEVQQFYYRLSAIVRGYVERRYEILAPEMTTEEFLPAMLSDSRFDSRHKVQLREFLVVSDMVRYALHTPPVEECHKAIEAADDFVEQTKAGNSSDPEPQVDNVHSGKESAT